MSTPEHSHTPAAYVTVQHDGDVLVGTVERASFGSQEAAAVLDAVMQHIEQRAKPMRHFAVDLSGVNFVNSSGLGSLLVLRKHAVARPAHCYLVGVQSALQEITDMMKIPTLFTMVPSRSELDKYVQSARSAGDR